MPPMSGKVGQRGTKPDGRRGNGRDQHRRGERVDPGHFAAARAVRDPVTEDHIRHEKDAVAEGEHEPERLAADPDRGDGRDTRRGQRKRADVPSGPGADGGQDHGAEEFDRAHGGQRQPGHRQVEHRIHRGEHGTESILENSKTASDGPRK